MGVADLESPPRIERKCRPVFRVKFHVHPVCQDSYLQAQEIHSLVLTMTSQGEKPPLKLLALGKCVNGYSLGDGITN